MRGKASPSLDGIDVGRVAVLWGSDERGTDGEEGRHSPIAECQTSHTRGNGRGQGAAGDGGVAQPGTRVDVASMDGHRRVSPAPSVVLCRCQRWSAGGV